jgi:hypothetical protein
MESNTKEGFIHEFLSKPLPINWDNRSIAERRMYWSGFNNPQGECRVRTKICAAEVWCECFSKDISFMRKSDAAEINSILDNTPGWEKDKTGRKFGPYGCQRGYTLTTFSNLDFVAVQKNVVFRKLHDYDRTTTNVVEQKP